MLCHVAVGTSDSETDDVSEAVEQSVTRASSTEPTSKVPLPIITHTYAVHVRIICVILQNFPIMHMYLREFAMNCAKIAKSVVTLVMYPTVLYQATPHPYSYSSSGPCDHYQSLTLNMYHPPTVD